MVRAVSNDLEIHVALVRVHLTAASHDLKVVAQHVQALLVLPDEGECLVVDHAVRDRLRVQETAVHKQVTERSTCNEPKLVGPKLHHLAELLLLLPNLVLRDFVLGLVFVPFYFYLFDLEAGLDLSRSIKQVLEGRRLVFSVVYFLCTLRLRQRKNHDLGVVVNRSCQRRYPPNLLSVSQSSFFAGFGLDISNGVGIEVHRDIVRIKRGCLQSRLSDLLRCLRFRFGFLELLGRL